MSNAGTEPIIREDQRNIKVIVFTLRGLETISWVAILSNYLYLPSEKESTLKEKNLLPVGANSFLLE